MSISAEAEVVRVREGVNLEFLARRALAAVQLFRPSDGWLAMVLLVLNLMVVVWSVEKAEWVDGPNLVGVVILAMLTALALAKVPRWAMVIALPLGLVIGLWVIIVQLTSYQGDGVQLENAQELWERLSLWYAAAKSGSISIDSVPFAFGLMAASWLSGYLAAWVFIRYRNFWGVFIIGGIGLLSNLTYLPASASIDLGFYLLTALLLVARVQSVRRRRDWRERNFQYDDHLGLLSVSDSFFLAVIVLLIAFLLPVGRHWQPTHDIYESMRSPMISWEDDFNRLFAGLPARRPLPYRIWGDVIAFQGTINPTTTPVLQVNSPLAMYWKARTYGTYTPQGWVSEDTVFKPTDWAPAYAVSNRYRSRFEIAHAVTPHYGTRYLFAGGQVIGVDRDVRVETYDSPIYSLDMTNAPSLTLTELPTKLATASLNLERALQTSGFRASNSVLSQNLPGDFELVDVDRQQGMVQRVKLAEVIPEQLDTLSLRSAKGNAEPGETYLVTSSVSLAQPGDLRTAGVDYPTWALDKYTQLPPATPQRVRDLAQRITGDAPTHYDKAKAIESYLKTLTYNLEIDPPPFNADGVDYFLFEQREGYSEYFGSAMTVLLRTQGIPARLATGYTVGDKVEDHDVFIVADSHSHAWVEVFFPNYGWIPFEPTPGEKIPEAYIPAPDPEQSAINIAAEDTAMVDCEDDDEDCDEDSLDAGIEAGLVGDGNSLYRYITRALPWILVALAIASVGGASGWFFWKRCMTPVLDPRETYRRLGFLGRLSAMGPMQHQTPLQYQRRLAEQLPGQQENLSVIVDSYVRNRYGQKELGEEESGRLTRAWLGVRLPLLFHMLRRRNV